MTKFERTIAEHLRFAHENLHREKGKRMDSSHTTNGAIHNQGFTRGMEFAELEISLYMIKALHEINPRFDRDVFVKYVAGDCGPQGGKVKGAKA